MKKDMLLFLLSRSGGQSADILGDYLGNYGTEEGKLLMKELDANESTRRMWRVILVIVGVILIALGLFLKFFKI